MRKEMPEWLKKYYNRLWLRFRNQAFVFKDVTKELGISRVMTVKTLWELEQRGFVNKERSEVDYRARIYRLISPEDISFATVLCVDGKLCRLLLSSLHGSAKGF